MKKGIASWDIHYPYHSKSSMRILKQFIKDFKPNYFILGGDQLDMDMISSFNKHKPKLVEGKRLKKHYNDFQRYILTPIESILPNTCDKYFIIGNHEYRINRLIEEYPQMEGFAEIENNLDLDNWNVIPYNRHIQLGDMYFIHGLYINKYHTAKHLSVYQNNIFYGHNHDSQSYSYSTPMQNNPKIAQCVGCMCDKNPSYMNDKPNNWINQFMYFYLNSDNTFYHYIVSIINDKAVINNKLYG